MGWDSTIFRALSLMRVYIVIIKNPKKKPALTGIKGDNRHRMKTIEGRLL
jgi:hypothetical protein